MKKFLTTLLSLSILLTGLQGFASNLDKLKGKKILYTQRSQFEKDHHNTATLFQLGQINEAKFRGGSAMSIYDVDSGKSTVILESKEGIIRDPELSYDAKKIIFSMRKDKNDFYHIYEMNIDGSGLKQLTFAKNISDIDPVYLPNGDIIFASTRHAKFCMCNRHIMANLFRMGGDGSNIYQISVNTLFDSHPTVMADGRILYERWEYVDRNFGDAQGLWTVNPDGTRHAIYYGNNTAQPGGVIDARQIPNTDLVVCIFGSCHDRPWGALAVIDRTKGIDGDQSVVALVPESAKKLLAPKGVFNYDAFRATEFMLEDPYPVDKENFLVSIAYREKFEGKAPKVLPTKKADIYLLNTDGTTEQLISADQDVFDPIIIEARPLPKIIPDIRNDEKDSGTFYVQDVYEGTHMKGVNRGDAKYIRVIETPEKRTWSLNSWTAQGAQAPGVNWDGFENKRIIGEAEIEADGSVSFNAPANKFVYFQLLDKDKKMIQSMRSGTMLMPDETYGCIGCHEDRLMTPMMDSSQTMALKKAPQSLKQFLGKEPETFSYMQNIQPILDKHCVKCHDATGDNKLILSSDKNMYFNASYVNLNVAKIIKVVGAGPSSIQLPYSWGSHASKLTEIIDGNHKKVKLSKEEKEMIYTWLDINAPYYPTYETSFNNHAGRSPLTSKETAEITKLTDLDFSRKGKLGKMSRKDPAIIYFDRPELSPILKNEKLANNKAGYNRVLELIKLGKQRLEETPRGDILSEMHTVDPLIQLQLNNFHERKAEMERFKEAIIKGEKVYDKKD